MARRTKFIQDVVDRLEVLYGRPRRLARFEPMDELVSCILSQHSSDAHSFPAFTRLKEAYPTWENAAAASPEELADVIRAAGLANQKARNILGCLSLIHERLGNYSLEALREMPTLVARTWLLALPGVGPKTASIVLCFSMGRETIPVDTHIFRVSWRLGIIPEAIGEVKAHDLLLEIVPPELAFRYHTDLIQHGRVVCRAPLPLCEECTVSDMCQWYAKGGPGKRKIALSKNRKKPANLVKSRAGK